MSNNPEDQINHRPDEELDSATLADTDESQEDRGRIGYGKNERTSSWLLGAILVLLVIAIGAWQWFGKDNGNDSADHGARSIDTPAKGKPAPDFTLHTFDGEEITLSDQQGKVVVLNFWGSWCEPCKREMPAFQRYWETAPDDVMVIGVGAKQDPMDRSQEFADSFGVTYPIGRDDGGDRVSTGSIASDYSITFYPMTFIINPDGIISAVVIGELDEKQLDDFVNAARDEVKTNAHDSPMVIENRRRSA